MIPHAFAAEANGGRILRLDAGHEDAGAPVAFRATSAAVAPAGVEGDCLFDRLRLVVTWSADATLTVTPLLDGRPVHEAMHMIVLERAGAGVQSSQAYELVFRRSSASGRVYGLRGTWFALRIEGTQDSEGEVFIEPSSLTYEVYTPTQERPR